MDYILPVVSYLITLLCLLLGGIAFRRADKVFKVVFLQVLTGFATETIGWYYMMMHYNNVMWFNIYILLSTPILGVAGAQMFAQNIFRYIIYGVLAIWEISCILYLSMFFSSITEVFANRIFLSASLVLVIIYILSLINIVLFNRQPKNYAAYFLLCIAVLLYYSCNIPTFGFLNYLTANYPVIARHIFDINQTLSIFYYIVIAYVFFQCIPRKKVINSPANERQ